MSAHKYQSWLTLHADLSRFTHPSRVWLSPDTTYAMCPRPVTSSQWAGGIVSWRLGTFRRSSQPTVATIRQTESEKRTHIFILQLTGIRLCCKTVKNWNSEIWSAYVNNTTDLKRGYLQINKGRKYSAVPHFSQCDTCFVTKIIKNKLLFRRAASLSQQNDKKHICDCSVFVWMDCGRANLGMAVNEYLFQLTKHLLT